MQRYHLTKGEWDKKYKEWLYHCYTKIKEIVSDNNSDKETEARKLLFTQLANDFYEEFKESDIPLSGKPEVYEKNPDYIFTIVKLPYGCFFVPYHIYELVASSPEVDLEPLFAKEIPWLYLTALILEKRLANVKHLTPSDVLILKMLTNIDSGSSWRQFPISYSTISNRVRKVKAKTVEARLAYLIKENIYRELALLNPWKLGWRLFLNRFHQNDEQKNQEGLVGQWVRAKEYLLGDEMFQVFQQPNALASEDWEALKKLMKGEGRAKLWEVHQVTFNWNLNELGPSKHQSFPKPPNLGVELHEEVKPTVTFTAGEVDLEWVESGLSLADQGNLPQIINYLVNAGMIIGNYKDAAASISLGEAKLKELLRFLVKEQVMAFGSRFKFIGAGHEYNFIIEGGDQSFNTRVTQNLTLLPFSYTYQGEGMIAGRCQVPDCWVGEFLNFLTHLTVGTGIRVRFGKRIQVVSFFNPNIYYPEDYELTVFGATKRR